MKRLLAIVLAHQWYGMCFLEGYDDYISHGRWLAAYGSEVGREYGAGQSFACLGWKFFFVT